MSRTGGAKGRHTASLYAKVANSASNSQITMPKHFLTKILPVSCCEINVYAGIALTNPVKNVNEPG
jgi:hypothetical protein